MKKLAYNSTFKNEDYGIWSHHFRANRWKQWQTLLLGALKSLQMVTVVMKLKDTCFLEGKLRPIWKESYNQSRQHIKKQRHYFANKGQSSQGCGFSSGHVWLAELDCEES